MEKFINQYVIGVAPNPAIGAGDTPGLIRTRKLRPAPRSGVLGSARARETGVLGGGFSLLLWTLLMRLPGWPRKILRRVAHFDSVYEVNCYFIIPSG